MSKQFIEGFEEINLGWYKLFGSNSLDDLFNGIKDKLIPYIEKFQNMTLDLTEISIHYKRLETDEEYEKRLKKEEKKNKIKKLNELNIYNCNDLTEEEINTIVLLRNKANDIPNNTCYRDIL